MANQIRISFEAARVNSKYTQREAAKLLDISLSTLQNYENGKTTPNWTVLEKMANTYKIPIGMLNCKT